MSCQIIKAKKILDTECQVIVNPVNCEGIIETQLHQDLNKIYPELEEIYKQKCEEGFITMGSIHLYKNILFFPIKETQREPTKLENLEKALKCFMRTYEALEIKSIAFPNLTHKISKELIALIPSLMLTSLNPCKALTFIYLE